MGQMPSAPAPQATKSRPDAYAVVALSAGLGAVGFLLGPAMTVGFAWLFGVTGTVAGVASRSGTTMATAGLALGILSALGAAAAILFS